VSGYKDPRGYCRFYFKLVGVSINIAIQGCKLFRSRPPYEEGTVVRHLNGDPGSNAFGTQ
jgi:hypothetical protein